jgi:hypothetical protein
MVLEIYVDYLFCIAFGIAMGIIITWTYFRFRLEKRNLAQVIDAAMIEKNVNELNDIMTYMNQATALLNTSTEELSNRIKIIQDIELNVEQVSTLELQLDELGLEKGIDILEKNI